MYPIDINKNPALSMCPRLQKKRINIKIISLCHNKIKLVPVCIIDQKAIIFL
jgi:aminoglycoside phosphotransferase family enzyme